MVAHFFTESPSHPGEQKARLGPPPPPSLIRAQIPFVVFAEDALSIVHRVPTTLHDQQLLVPDGRVDEAVKVLCNTLPYRVIDGHTSPSWLDSPVFNRARPYTFSGTPTVMIEHTAPDILQGKDEPEPLRILVHATSTFHFDMHDTPRTCLNPAPPTPDFTSIRFPTIPAFYDALIDIYLEPPLGVVHQKLQFQLTGFRGYLSLYTVSNEGFCCDPASTGELHLIPNCLQVLEQVKEGNRLTLARHFLKISLDWQAEALERMIIKEAQYKARGLLYKKPQIPYHPLARAAG
ncbi:hypothetical protein IW262DRAFT_1489292 [Armillaria fumosa]|nr:hypothetical protein IW262DRAFT_1489292 [Armillaria fumosa]